MLFDDDRPRKPPKAEPGENLADLSVDELRERIALYRAEIARIEADIARKEQSRAAAASVFRS